MKLQQIPPPTLTRTPWGPQCLPEGLGTCTQPLHVAPLSGIGVSALALLHCARLVSAHRCHEVDAGRQECYVATLTRLADSSPVLKLKSMPLQRRRSR